MAQLSSTPQAETPIRLEQRKSYSLGLWFQAVDPGGTSYNVDLTGSTITLVVKEPARKGGATVITEVATLSDPLVGIARFDLQAADLDLDKGAYRYTATLLDAQGYSIVFLKGELTIEENQDPNVANVYVGNDPDTVLHVSLTHDNKVTVKLWKGLKGDQGPAGATGPQGEQGEVGPQGEIGPEGPQGDVGPTGPQGIQGPRGLKGDKGDTGDPGPQGIQGPQGEQGEQGETGPQGIQGPIGPEGDQGPQGPIGPEGDQGPQGIQGPPGADGELTGPAGGDLAGTYPNPTLAVDRATKTEFDAHVADATDAHDASAISFAPASGIAATDVQAAIVEAKSDAEATAAGVQTNLDNHLADTSDAHDASAISFSPASGIAATDVQGAIVEAKSDAESTASTALTSHLNDASDAHDAAAISYAGSTNLAATDVEGALDELDTEKASTGSVTTVQTNLTDHLNDTSDAHDASAISYAGGTGMSATDVEAAIDELATEKANDAALTAHIDDTSDAHDASAISYAGSTDLAATNAEAALDELDTEKSPKTRDGLPSYAPSTLAQPYNSRLNVFNWKGSNTRKLGYGLARALGGGVLNLGAIGDSLFIGTDGASVVDADAPPRRAARQLARHLGIPDAGGFAPLQAAVNFKSDLWTGTVDLTGRGYGVLAAGQSLTFRTTIPCTIIDVFYSNLSGDFTYTIDGGAAIPVDATGADTFGKSTQTGLSDEKHTVVITAGATAAVIGGIAPRNTHGVVMHNLARGGTRAGSAGGATVGWTHVASTNSIYHSLKTGVLEQLGVTLDALLVNLGANDLSAADSVANVTAALTTIRGWVPNTDFILVRQHEVPGTNGANWDSFSSALYTLAETLDCPLIDLRHRFGDVAALQTASLLGADNIHSSFGLNREEGRAISQILGGADQPLAKDTAVATFTNKRITKRVFSVADTATLTIDSDSYDSAKVTALAQAMTIAAPTGTPTAMQGLIIRIKDNGTARPLTWNAAFRAIGVTLPTTTVVSKTTYVGCIRNTDDTKWDVIAVAQEA